MLLRTNTSYIALRVPLRPPTPVDEASSVLCLPSRQCNVLLRGSADETASCGREDLLLCSAGKRLVPTTSHDASLIVNINAQMALQEQAHPDSGRAGTISRRGIRFQKSFLPWFRFCARRRVCPGCPGWPWMGSKEPWLAAVRFQGPLHREPARGGVDPPGEQMVLSQAPPVTTHTHNWSSKQVPGGDQSQPWEQEEPMTGVRCVVRGPLSLSLSCVCVQMASLLCRSGRVGMMFLRLSSGQHTHVVRSILRPDE